MPIFGGRDEAENRFKQAKRLSRPNSKEFDLDTAIGLLEGAVLLKPDNKKYSQKLEEIRHIKANTSLKFSMRAWTLRAVTFPNKKQGVRLTGVIVQGTIRDGDEVRILESYGTVYEVDSATGRGYAVAGQQVTLAIVTDWRPSRYLVGIGVEGTAEEVELAPGAPLRNVTVDRFTREKGGGQEYRRIYHCARISVEHKGTVPCVMEMPLNYSPKRWLGWGIFFAIMSTPNFYLIVNDPKDRGTWLFGAIFLLSLGLLFIWRGRRPSRRFESLGGIRFFDKNAFAEWRRTTYHDLSKRLPKKLKIHGRKDPATLPQNSFTIAREWAKYKKRRFRWGVALLAVSGPFYFFAGVLFYNAESDWAWFIPAAIFTALGIYCLRRSRMAVQREDAGVAAATEWAKRIFDVPNTGALECSRGFGPFVRIEPNQIVWLGKGKKPEEIEKAKEVLVSIAEKIEKQG